jgi:hypothetical protein
MFLEYKINMDHTNLRMLAAIIGNTHYNITDLVGILFTSPPSLLDQLGPDLQACFNSAPEVHPRS